MFHKTSKELKKIKIFPILSYALLTIFIGKLISIASNFGNNSYVISSIGIPFISAVIDRLTEGKLLNTFYKEWKEAPVVFHLLIIFNIIIYYCFVDQLKNLWTKDLYNQSKNSQS